MNFSIYMEGKLYDRLQESVQEMHVTRNSIIRSAIVEWLEKHRSVRWQELVKECKVGDDFPDVEKLRSELLPPRRVDL